MAKKEEKVMTHELFKQASRNKIELGCKILEVKKLEGNQKKDKDNNLMFFPDGTPIRWDESYYATFTFQGGEVSQKISKDTYSSIKQDSDLVESSYLMIGRVSVQTVNNRSFPVVKADSFIKLF